MLVFDRKQKIPTVMVGLWWATKKEGMYIAFFGEAIKQLSVVVMALGGGIGALLHEKSGTGQTVRFARDKGLRIISILK